MSPEHTNEPDREEQLNAILASWLEAAESGHPLDEQQFIARHPEFAAELSQHLATWKRFAPIGPPSASGVSYDPGSADAAVRGSPDPAPRFFADYELLEILSQGGMGVVYKARQKNPNRLVALKMIRAGRLLSEEDIQRFRNEAELVTQLDNPNLVPIYEVGEWRAPNDGRAEGVNPPVLYFSMKLMEGGSLAKAVASGQWPVASKESERNAAQLMVTIAKAIHHAHQRGILHRDLKPSNILLDADGRPHVSDFGLGKRVIVFGDRSPDASLTETGAIVGTPQYMSPEQASGIKGAITTATDVYGLGTILYTLLTGQPPFQEATPLDTLLRVKDRDPDRPSSINPRVDRDLETICLKCLEKEPPKRYSSALALAEDLERWLKSEPIQARPLTRSARLLRWCRKNPLIAALTGTTALLVVALIVALAVSTLWIASERTDAVTQRDAALTREASLRRHRYVDKIRLAHGAWSNNDMAYLRQVLDELIPGPDEEDDLRGFEWYWLDRQCSCEPVVLEGHRDEVSHLAYSPDASLLASSGWDECVMLWDPKSGKLLDVLRAHTHHVNWVTFSPDGKTLASADGEGIIRLWNVASRNLSGCLLAHKGDAMAVEFSPDGKFLATGGKDCLVKLWDAKTLQPFQVFTGHTKGIRTLAFSKQWSVLASAGWDGRLRFWRVPPPIESPLRGADLLRRSNDESSYLGLSMQRPHPIMSLAFRHDGARIALGMEKFNAIEQELESGRGVEHSTTGTQHAVAYSYDDMLCASAGEDQRIHVHDLGNNPCRTRVIHVPPRAAKSLAFSPHGDRLASGHEDHNIRIWDIARITGRRVIGWLPTTDGDCAFSPNGDLLVNSWWWDGGLLLLKNNRLNEIFTLQWAGERAKPEPPFRQSVLHTRSVNSIAFAQDEKTVAVSQLLKNVRVWDVTKRKMTAELPGTLGEGSVVAFSEDSNFLVTGQREICLWNLAINPPHNVLSFRTPSAARCVAISPDRSQLAAGLDDGDVWIWEVAQGALRHEPLHLGQPDCLSFSPDGKLLAVATIDPQLYLLDTSTGAIVQSIRCSGHFGGTSVAFSRDGKTLALACVNGVRLFQVKTGKEFYLLSCENTWPIHVHFSPDGNTLIGWIRGAASLPGLHHYEMAACFWQASEAREEDQPGPDSRFKRP